MANTYKEVSQRLPKEVAAQWAEGIQAMNERADELQREGKLPADWPTQARAQELKTTKVDLRLQTLEFLAANTFREPTAQEKKVLAPRGYDIFLSTEAKTLYAVVDENKDHFWTDELDYVNARPNCKRLHATSLDSGFNIQRVIS